MGEDIALSQFSFFSDISMDRLSEIQTFSRMKTYELGAVVFENNEPAKNIYVLVSGDINLAILFKEEIITKEIKHEEYISTNVQIFEKPIIIEKVKAGDLFGWSALVAPEKMTATAKCTAACDIIIIPADRLKQMFINDPSLGYLLSSRISSLIAKRLNSRTEKLVTAWCSLFETEKISAV